METNIIITYLACIFFLFIIGRIFILPLKSILKLIGNSLIGGILIFIINLIGTIFNFHIGLNIATAAVVGILGIPRCNPFNYFEIILMTRWGRLISLHLSLSLHIYFDSLGTDEAKLNVPNASFYKKC